MKVGQDKQQLKDISPQYEKFKIQISNYGTERGRNEKQIVVIPCLQLRLWILGNLSMLSSSLSLSHSRSITVQRKRSAQVRALPAKCWPPREASLKYIKSVHVFQYLIHVPALRLSIVFVFYSSLISSN